MGEIRAVESKQRGYILLFMHYRMELRLTMEIAVQKCLTQHVRMKEEFVFMEK